jgi:hypothetical protein
MFTYPAKALFNRPVPKTKLYANAKPTRAVKEKFISQIKEIIWKYKLSPETTNLAARDGFTEIQVFEIILKQQELGTDVLSAIDRAIPYPIIFQLRHEEKLKTVAAYKRPAADGSGTWVIEEYFETEWRDDGNRAAPLPVALDMKSLYEQMIKAFIELSPRNGEALESLVGRVRMIRKCRRELRALEAKINSEKQFNRKVELKAQIREINNQITTLTV